MPGDEDSSKPAVSSGLPTSSKTRQRTLKEVFKSKEDGAQAQKHDNSWIEDDEDEDDDPDGLYQPGPSRYSKCLIDEAYVDHGQHRCLYPAVC